MSEEDTKGKIHQVVMNLNHATSSGHRFGGIEYKFGKREIGHIHGNHLDIPFPIKIRNEVIEQGIAN